MLYTLEEHKKAVRSVSLSNDNKYIVSGSDDKTIKIWDFKKGNCLNSLKGNKRGLRSVSISNDSKYIVSTSGDRTIKIWDLKNGNCLNS